MNMKIKKRIIDVIIYAFLACVCVFALFPVIYMILGSFRSNMEMLAHAEWFFPREFTLDGYMDAFTNRRFNIPRMLWNNIYYTVCSMVITISLSVLAGYVFARGDFAGSKVLFAIFSATMFISVGGTTIYPVFDVLRAVGLDKGLNALLIKKIFGFGIVNIYLVRGFVNQLPKELDEAAAMDGCGFMGTFFRVILPLLKPIVATLAILVFRASWNDYYMPTIFTSSNPEQQTLMVGLYKLRQTSGNAVNYNMLMAGATVSLLPILIVYAICNKYFVDGITAGAVKG